MTADDENDVQQARLRTVGQRQPLHRYVASAWRSRSFVPRQSVADPILESGPTAFERATWLVLPFVEALLWFVVLAVVLDISWGDVANPFTFILIGVLVFAYTARSIERAAGSMVRARPLAAAFDLPDFLVPIATLWRQSGAFLMTFYALVLIVLVVPPTGALSLAWLLLPVLFGLQFLFNAGAGLLAAKVGQILPFTRLWLPWLLRAWMLVSCAVWPFSTMSGLGDGFLAAAEHNPLYLLIDMFRSILMEGAWPAMGSLVEFAAWAVALPLVGLLIFWLGGSRHADSR